MNPYIIKNPIITEKTVGLAKSKNIYTFEVEKSAAKPQIKEVVEQLYPVTVVNVRTVMVQSSFRKTGKRRMLSPVGRTKKAFVTLKQGDTIALFDVGSTEE